MRCKLLVVVLLLNAPSFCAKAQESNRVPSTSVIAALLNGSPRDIAWGAEYALEERKVSLLPLLSGLAVRWQPLPHRSVHDHVSSPLPPLTQEQRDQRDAMRAVLDGIIQLKGVLPIETLQQLAADFPGAAFVLLARMPPDEITPAIMELYRDREPPSYATTRTAATLLALHPPPGFAADLVKHLVVRTHVMVALPDSPSLGFGRSSGSCGGYGFPSDKPGWPETGKYILLDAEVDQEKANLSASFPGNAPIDAVRRVEVPKQQNVSGCGELKPLDSGVRMALLMQMLGKTTESAPFQVGDLISLNLKASSTEDFRTQLERYTQQQQSRYNDLKSALTRAGLLSEAEAADPAVLPRLQLLIEDVRQERTFPLNAPENQARNVSTVTANTPMDDY